MNDTQRVEDIQESTLALDTSFTFRCAQCGQCCRHREDLILSPMDIYRLAKALTIQPAQVYDWFCDAHIGHSSYLPVIRLAPVGEDLHCPLLDANGLCSVHTSKPAACALYPLGRYISPQEGGKVQYYLQPVPCGDHRHSVTVKEWLKDFDIDAEDKTFLQWHQIQIALYEKLLVYVKNNDMLTVAAANHLIRALLYFCLDTAEPFGPQFKKQVDAIMGIIDYPASIRRSARRHMGFVNWLRLKKAARESYPHTDTHTDTENNFIF